MKEHTFAESVSVLDKCILIYICPSFSLSIFQFQIFFSLLKYWRLNSFASAGMETLGKPIENMEVRPRAGWLTGQTPPCSSHHLVTYSGDLWVIYVRCVCVSVNVNTVRVRVMSSVSLCVCAGSETGAYGL